MMLRGLPAVTGIISPYTGLDISSTYHMDPTGIPVPDGNHVGPGGALVADYDPAIVTRARGIFASMATWQANAAHIQTALATPGLSQAQIQFANSVLAPLLADISSQAHGLIADLPAYAVQDAQAWAASSPSPVIPDTGANSGRTIQQTIDLNNQIFDNQLSAYADPATVARLAAQNASFTASENAIASAITAANASGTQYYIGGQLPPSQYQPQNLPTEPSLISVTAQQQAANAGTASNPVINLSPSHATTSTAMPNIVGTANGTATPQTASTGFDLMAQLQTLYGPLPLWGWLVGAGVGAVVLMQMEHKK